MEAGGFQSEGGRTAHLIAIGLLLVAYVRLKLFEGELQSSREDNYVNKKKKL